MLKFYNRKTVETILNEPQACFFCKKKKKTNKLLFIHSLSYAKNVYLMPMCSTCKVKDL